MRSGCKSSVERVAAILAGEKRYETKIPCAQGHVCERYAASGACVECTRIHNHANHMANADKRKKYMRGRSRSERTTRDRWAVAVLRAAKIRARKIGLEFNIKASDIELPEFCPALGIALNYDSIEPRFSRPSLDRSDNKKGYVAGNVRVISFRANQIKNDASAKELAAILEYVERLEREVA